MQINFKIAKYKKIDDSFVHDGYDEYVITFKKGLKVHQLRIVVNGFLTNKTINLINGNSGYKNQILSAISDFKNNNIDKNNVVTKPITLGFLNSVYNKKIITNVQNYLININKEESRDKLTEFNLI